MECFFNLFWNKHFICCVFSDKNFLSHIQVGLRDQLKILLKQAGLPDMCFHDLRHSSATLLLSAGIHPKVVQEILGHSQISMTMDIYSHVLPTMQEEAMNKLNDIIGTQKDDENP